ncbi:hypothetical protein FHY11_002522 [Xanthomonas arboricola]|nr:hypothetical protein [Xanthomonas euroxanthea]
MATRNPSRSSGCTVRITCSSVRPVAAAGRIEAEVLRKGLIHRKRVGGQVPDPGADDRPGRQCQLHPLGIAARHGFGLQRTIALAGAVDHLVHQVRIFVAQQRVLEVAVARVRHLRCGFDGDIHQPHHAAVLAADRRGGGIPVGDLADAVTQHRQCNHFLPEALACLHHPRKCLRDGRVGFLPHLGHRLAQRLRMTLAHRLHVYVVVEQAQLRPPQHRTEQGGIEHHRQRRAQRLRPGLGRAHRRGRPIVGAHQGPHLAAPRKKLQANGLDGGAHCAHVTALPGKKVRALWHAAVSTRRAEQRLARAQAAHAPAQQPHVLTRG